MNDRDRFLATYYNPDTLTRESSGVFGLIDNRFHTTPFLPVTLDSGLVNPKFLDFALNVQSFCCDCDRGSASFRCEIRATKKGSKQYWYAYKKLDGKTNRFNIGDLSKINFATIEEAVAVVCGLQVAQKKSATKKAIALVVAVDAIANPTTTRAGNGKSDKHLQPSVIDCFESLAIAQNEIITLNKMLQDAWDDTKAANEKEHSKWQEVERLKREVRIRNEEIAHFKESEPRRLDAMKEKRAYIAKLLTHKDELESMVDRHFNTIEALRNELKQANELIERSRGLKELHNEALHFIHKLECEASKREDDVAGYAYMYDQYSNKIFAYQTLIEKYRAMTTDKTKKANPRYAYLMDFLADIDKLC